MNYRLFLALFILLMPYTAEAGEIKNHADFEIVANLSAVNTGDKLQLLIKQKIDDGWHTYWKNSGDSGTAISFDFFAPNGFEFSEVIFPVPKRISYDGMMNYGYEGVNYYLVDVTVPEGIDFDNITFSVDIEWLACAEICIPEFGEFDINIAIGDGKKINLDVFAEADKYWAINKDIVVDYYEEAGKFVLKLPADWIGSDASNVYFFPEEWGMFKFTAEQEFSSEAEYSYIKIDRDTLPINALNGISGVLAWDGGNALGIKAEYKKNGLGLHSEKEKTAEIGLLMAVVFAVLGGLILNLMPCVFPVLSMKALSLVKLKEKERTHAQMHGIAYLMGILVSFGIIAGTLMILKAGGEHIGWGFQLQNPMVVMILAWMLFLVGLSLSGFFELGGKFANVGNKLANKSGISGSFFTGFLAAVVATPCTAPFMGVAIGYAMTQPPLLSMIVFMSMGFGLALPYLLLCFIPTLQHIIPKPGAWMDSFKQFLAFPMYASAIWLVWVLSMQGGDDAVLTVLSGALCFVIIIWSVSKQSEAGTTKILYWLINVMAVGSLVFLVSYSYRLSNAEIVSDKQTYYGSKSAFSDISSLETLLKESDDPVFVNMTAAWCITCKVNEKAVLSSDKLEALFEENKVSYIVGDWTNRNAEIANYLESFGRNGVPIYVYYPARNVNTGSRAEPVVLPQMLSIKDFESLF